MTPDPLLCLSRYPRSLFFFSTGSPLCQLVPFSCCALHLLVNPSLWCQAWEVSFSLRLQLRSPWLLLPGAESSLAPHVFIPRQVPGCNPTLVYAEWGAEDMLQRDGNRPLNSGPGRLGTEDGGGGLGVVLMGLWERERENAKAILSPRAKCGISQD